MHHPEGLERVVHSEVAFPFDEKEAQVSGIL